MGTYRGKPGGKLRIRVTKGGRRDGGEAEAAPEDDDPGRLDTYRPEDDIILPPEEAQIYFYDLGLRLRSVPGPLLEGVELERAYRPAAEHDAATPREGFWNEYVPVEYEVTGTVTVGPRDEGYPTRFTGDEGQLAALDRRMLGVGDDLDPFGYSSANGSGRSVPNVAPIPYEFSYGWLTAHLGGKVYVVGHRLEDDPDSKDVKWKPRKPGPRDGDERWNPYNLGSGTAQRAGYLDLKGSTGSFSGFAVRPPEIVALSDFNRPIYHYFDTTRHDLYKVTKLPAFDAPAAALTLDSSGPIHVYLKPVVHWTEVAFHAQDQFGSTHTLFVGPGMGVTYLEDVWFGGRIPTYPYWPSEFYPSPIDFMRVYGQSYMRMPLVRDGFARVLTAYRAWLAAQGTGYIIHGGQEMASAGVTLSWYNYGITPWYTLLGRLVGVVRQGRRMYYVWANSDFLANNEPGKMFEGGQVVPVGYAADITPSGLTT
jgi:hypothetical protein